MIIWVSGNHLNVTREMVDEFGNIIRGNAGRLLKTMFIRIVDFP